MNPTLRDLVNWSQDTLPRIATAIPSSNIELVESRELNKYLQTDTTYMVPFRLLYVPFQSLVKLSGLLFFEMRFQIYFSLSKIRSNLTTVIQQKRNFCGNKS